MWATARLCDSEHYPTHMLPHQCPTHPRNHVTRPPRTHLVIQAVAAGQKDGAAEPKRGGGDSSSSDEEDERKEEEEDEEEKVRFEKRRRRRIGFKV